MKWNCLTTAVCCMLAGGVLSPSPLRAQEPVSAQEPPACGEEIEKFCSHMVPGKLGLALCLNEHREELGAECRAKVDRGMAKIQQARRICGADLQKFCAGVQPGEGRLLVCLSAKKNELAPECRAQVEAVLAKTKGSAPTPAGSSATRQVPVPPGTTPSQGQ